jgi:hypothetical protein
MEFPLVVFGAGYGTLDITNFIGELAEICDQQTTIVNDIKAIVTARLPRIRRII